jgi:hypothetical protein
LCADHFQNDKRGTVVALFPITSQPPHATPTALEIPEMDARRIGLKSPSWIMLGKICPKTDLTGLSFDHLVGDGKEEAGNF